MVPIIYIMLLVSALLVAADQIIKQLVVGVEYLNLMTSEPIVLIPGVLQLTYTGNDGAALNIFSGQRIFLIVIVSLVVIGILYLMVFKHIRSKPILWSCAVIVAGGIGNLIDRIAYGYVIDYIEVLFFDFAIFNFADCLVTCGVLFLIVYLIFFHRDEKIFYFDKFRRKKPE